MPQRLQCSVRMKPQEVLALLRANSADDADILETLKGHPQGSLFPFPRRSLIVVRIDGHKFRLHLQGGRLGANLSRPHVDGSVEAIAGGSRINAELKGFRWAFPAVYGFALIALATIFGLMLIEVEVSLAIVTMALLAFPGVLFIVVVCLAARSMRKRFVDLLSRLFDR